MTLLRTQSALRRWSRALSAELYDIRIIPEDSGSVVLRRFNSEQLVNASSWLRHMNAQGCHIYGRPFDHRQVLIDDLCPDALAALVAAHEVSAVVETSAHNFQAWVTISALPVAWDAAAAVARLLAARFNGDAGAASAVQVGRLPGFANRKAIHQRGDGSFPWARLHHAMPVVDGAGVALMTEALETTQVVVPAPPSPPHARMALAAASPAKEWQEAARRISARLPLGTPIDRSRVDIAVTRRLLRRGATAGQALAVVLNGPRAAAMNEAAGLRYAERTVRAAVAARADHRGKGG